MPVSQGPKPKYIEKRIYSSATNCAIDTTIEGDWEARFGGTIVEVGAYNDTAGTTGTMVADIHIGGATIMTTNKLDIDTTEKTTETAATAPGLTTTTFVKGDIFTFDVDAVHTTPAVGLVIWMKVIQTN